MNITLTLQRGTILMNALTAVKPTPAPVAQQYHGFSFTPSAQSPRLLELTFSAETTTQFLQQVAQWPVQALEYKSSYASVSARSSTICVAISCSRC